MAETLQEQIEYIRTLGNERPDVQGVIDAMAACETSLKDMLEIYERMTVETVNLEVESPVYHFTREERFRMSFRKLQLAFVRKWIKR